MEAHSADIIAALIRLKTEVEARIGSIIKMTITGASEAHLLSTELSQAGVRVIVTPIRPFPLAWEDRRMYVLPYDCHDDSDNPSCLIDYRDLHSQRTLRSRRCWHITLRWGLGSWRHGTHVIYGLT